VALAQLEKEDAKGPRRRAAASQSASAGDRPDDLLRTHRDRQAVEEQKVRLAVDEAIRQARRNLKNDPDGTLASLCGTCSIASRIIRSGGCHARRARDTACGDALRDSAAEVQRLKLNKGKSSAGGQHDCVQRE
jgi:hypothetical protein